MTWEEIRTHHPHQWLVVEVVQAHDEAQWYVLDDLAIHHICPSAQAAHEQYQAQKRLYPQRELLAIHTTYPEAKLEIVPRGVGPRRTDATPANPPERVALSK